MRVGDSEPRVAERLARLLAAGGVAIMPCDTIYGIVGAVPESEARIRGLKGRAEKSFLQLIGGAGWLARFGALTLPEALAGYWPGPLTIIFPVAGGSVALRVPSDPLLRDLLERLDRPLYSTSVNRSGQPALWRVAEILEQFEAAVDLVVDAGDLPGRQASTIVDVGRHPFQVLRQGSLELPEEALR